MKPFDYFTYCFRHYADFSGRARRSEYWYFVLFSVLIYIGITILYCIFAGSPIDPYTYTYNPGFIMVNGLVALGFFLPSIAVLVRRFHDIGKSGMWVLWFYVAIFACEIIQFILVYAGLAIISIPISLAIFGISIWVLVLLCKDSQPGANQYGPNPKDPPTYKENQF